MVARLWLPDCQIKGENLICIFTSDLYKKVSGKWFNYILITCENTKIIYKLFLLFYFIITVITRDKNICSKTSWV